MSKTSIKSLQEVVDQMKAEVLADISANIVPVDVSSFGDLHDYVDGNCYGGFCDDDGITDALIELHGGRDPEHEGMPDAVIAFVNDAQNAIHAWIASGEMCRSAEIVSDLPKLKELAPGIRESKQKQREKSDLPAFLAYDDMTPEQQSAFDTRQGISAQDRLRIGQRG